MKCPQSLRLHTCKAYIRHSVDLCRQLTDIPYLCINQRELFFPEFCNRQTLLASNTEPFPFNMHLNSLACAITVFRVQYLPIQRTVPKTTGLQISRRPKAVTSVKCKERICSTFLLNIFPVLKGKVSRDFPIMHLFIQVTCSLLETQ